MKKKLYVGIMAISALLLSCGNKANAEGTSENLASSESTQLTENSVYTIENGKIIPMNGKPTIVDFSATWCPPCRQLKPIFEQLKEEFKGRINFITIDVDENQDLSTSDGVQSIPMLIFLNKDGQIQNTIVGFQNRDQLLAAINTYFGF